MPIPALQENGFLPPGLYLADLDELRERFGRTSERRRMLFNRLPCGIRHILTQTLQRRPIPQGLQMFVDAARHVEALRMFIR